MSNYAVLISLVVPAMPQSGIRMGIRAISCLRLAPGHEMRPPAVGYFPFGHCMAVQVNTPPALLSP